MKEIVIFVSRCAALHLACAAFGVQIDKDVCVSYMAAASLWTCRGTYACTIYQTYSSRTLRCASILFVLRDVISAV